MATSVLLGMHLVLQFTSCARDTVIGNMWSHRLWIGGRLLSGLQRMGCHFAPNTLSLWMVCLSRGFTTLRTGFGESSTLAGRRWINIRWLHRGPWWRRWDLNRVILHFCQELVYLLHTSGQQGCFLCSLSASWTARLHWKKSQKI